MDIPVTVHLPDDVYQRATEFAHLLGKDVADVLAETIVLSLAPIATQSEMMPPVATGQFEALIGCCDVSAQ
jgi:hypothetical protein